MLLPVHNLLSASVPVFVRTTYVRQVDALSIDWKISMARARKEAGPNMTLAGNIDPVVLMGPEAAIRSAVRTCIEQAGGRHVLNLGHGVEKETPESAVAAFVDAARSVKVPNLSS